MSDEHKTEVQDRAGVAHWDDFYEVPDAPLPAWQPTGYKQMAMVHALSSAMDQVGATSILEIGCGNSHYLPYLAKTKSIDVVAGIDYSEVGCELAANRLEGEGIQGEIKCVDLFADENSMGEYDFVFSLGLVEHYSDLQPVLQSMLKFVRPGGMLFTSIPNLYSLYGLASWTFHPDILAKHYFYSKRDLARAHAAVGLTEVQARRLAWFSLAGFNWNAGRRWLRLPKPVQKAATAVCEMHDRVLKGIGIYRAPPLFSQFVYATGQKPVDSVTRPASAGPVRDVEADD